MKAVGYFRELSGKQPRTLADQSKAFLELCKDQGYEVVASFVDGVNAEEDGRPGFRQLIEFLRRPEKGFIAVMTPSVGTLGRDLREAVRSCFELESLGARVMLMDSFEEASSRLLSDWAKSAEGRLGDRVRSAMRRKAVKGEVLGRPPYGYRVGNRHRLELVPEEAVVVRYIFRLYLQEGLGIRRIARCLNEEGIKTRRGGNWSMVSIRDILRNRAYLGTYSRFGVRVPGSHPALISPEDFRRTQDCLAARRSSYSPRQVTPFLLSGVAFCGYCGNKMIGVSRRQRWERRDGSERGAEYRYYQCESRTNRSLCDYHTRRAALLEEEVRQAILGQGQASSASLPRGSDEGAVLAEAQASSRRLRARLRRLDRRLEQHLDAVTRGRLTRERFDSLSLALGAEQLALDESLAEAERLAHQQASVAERARRQERALARLRGEWDRLPPPQRQALLRELVERVVVRDDGIRALLRP